MLLLVIAVCLSLTAQLAVAEFTVFGWMVSALPALAFFALSKLVFTATRPTPVPAPTPATVAPAPSPSDTATATVRPAAEPTTSATPPQRHEHTPVDTGKETSVSAVVGTANTTRTTDQPATAPPAAKLSSGDLAVLLPGARIFARAHHEAHGKRINANQLAVRLQVPTTIAKDVLGVLYPEPTTNTGPHNGTPIGATQ
jgi:hypothetical protein